MESHLQEKDLAPTLMGEMIETKKETFGENKITLKTISENNYCRSRLKHGLPSKHVDFYPPKKVNT